MKTIDGKKVNPLLKMALEMGPLVAFFLANAKGKSLVGLWPELGRFGEEPIFLATAVFMVAITISLVVSYWLTRTLPIMPVVTGVVVLVFGGLTLYLQDELFIKLKPTIINTLFGTILLGGLYFGKTFLGVVFGEVFKLDAEGWRKLTFRWGIFFLCLAVLNEFIWRNFSTDFWISFKVWGMMPISMVFTLSQMPLIMKHSTEPLGEE